MKTASAIYKMLRALDTSWYEIRVVQGNNIYGLDKLKSVTMHPMLTSESGISIGNACATECRVTLLEQSAYWPRMAQFTVDFRISSGAGGTKSEWITAGTFYTDVRSEDKDGNLSIVAFDGMMKADQSWTDKIPSESLPSTWPITAYDWASMIQNAELATFDDITQLDDNVAFIGLDTTTSIRDVLKSIAAVHAGNWIMTSDEKLRLIQFENVNEPEEGQVIRYSNLERSMVTFEDSPSLSPVTGVHLETEGGTVVESGTDTGYILKAMCDFSTSTGVAELCLSKIEQYSYKPFAVGDAHLDPIVEIGDSVKIDGTIYQVMTIDWIFSKDPVADVSAPYDQEVDHEYTIQNDQAKNYRKAMAAVDAKMGDYVQWDEVSTAIEQNPESVVIAASGTYVTQTEYDETISEIQNQLDGNIQSWSGNEVPTLNNSPAVDWDTATKRAEHVGDMYFINSDAGIPEAGNYYRFENNNGTYSWQLITDSLATEALARAAAALAAAEGAQDTADAAEAEAQLKGRIFVVRPTPPYDVGDLWFNNTDSVIKVCMTARASGSFVDSDWVKRDNYADYNELDAWLSQYSETIQDILNQVDKKAETYYQDMDPQLEWGVSTIAGVAIAGINVVGIDSFVVAAHKGDLWYRTTDNTTWYWDGLHWIQQDVPNEVFDQIDGKAQVFVSTPYPPYAVGDLWFNGTDSDIKTCIRARDSGSYVGTDWVKYNKYTDDSALEDFVEVTYSADLEVTQREISAKVQKDQSGTKTTFGWVMDETAHTWYSNNQEVMKVNRSGLSVKGTITATSGFIGSESSGFEINATNIHNGMTSLTDTTHNGVFIGTNGIALGAGNFTVTSGGAVTAKNLSITGGSIKLGGTASAPVFQVTSSGAVTASNLAITGGTIKIGGTSSNPVFNVSSSGAVTASNMTINGGSITIRDNSNNVIFSANSSGVTVNGNGRFTGTVYAGNIVSETAQAGAGYFNGSGITTGSIYGGDGNGQIAQYTLGDYNVARYNGAGAYTTASFSSGVQGSLYNADVFGLAISSTSGTYPAYFCATSITALSTMYANDFYIELGGDRQLGLKTHYHTVVVSQDGTVQFGQPTTERPDPFNVADTQAYRDGVAAVTVTSLDLEYTYDDEMHIYRLMGYAKNQAGTIVYQSTTGQWNTDRSAYVDGKADGADEVTVTTITRTYPDGESSYPYYDSPTLGKIIEFKAIATMSNNHSGTQILTVPADAAYNAGYADGSGSGAGSVHVTAMQYYTVSGEDTISYNSDNNTLSASVQATLSNGNTNGSIRTVTFPANLAYNAGAQSITVSSIGLNTSWSTSSTGYVYETANNRYAANIRATLNNNRAWTNTVYIPATDAFNAGSSATSTVLTIASGSVISTTASNYTAYDSGYNFGLSGNLYTSGSYQYGRVQIKNAAGTVLKTMRLVIPVSSGSVSSITVSRISGDMNDWEFDGNDVYVGVNLAAKNGSTTVYSTTGRVLVNDIVNFFAPASGTVLATETSTANNNYAFEVDTTGYTNAFYRSGNYQYVRFQLKDSDGYNLDIVRVKMASTSSAITEVLALTSDASNYTSYSRQASFYASSLYTPSGGSTTYARVQVNLNSGSSEIIRVAVPASTSVTVTDIESHCTSQDYSDYWQNSLGQWMLKVRAMSGSTTLYEKSLNVNHAVNWGKAQTETSWVQIMSSDYSLAGKQVTLYCYNADNSLIYQNNVRITYDDR